MNFTKSLLEGLAQSARPFARAFRYLAGLAAVCLPVAAMSIGLLLAGQWAGGWIQATTVVIGGALLVVTGIVLLVGSTMVWGMAFQALIRSGAEAR